jgi:hypothetical protein
MQQLLIRQTVEDNWERAAFIDFWDWGTCPSPPPTSNIIIVSVDPSIAPDGSNIAATDDRPVGKHSGTNNIRFARADFASNPYVVLHEFGHALGFIHETEDDSCNQRTGGGTSLEWQGDNAASVMDYATGCDPGVTTLSSWDTLGVRNAYGTKPAGTIAGLGGLALNIAQASTNLGAGIIGWPATGSSNDTWQRAGLTLTTVLGGDIQAAIRCLNISGGSVSSNATPLISWTCGSNFTNEQFHFTKVLWRAMGKMCITAESNVSGANLSLATCDAASALQSWDFFENDTRIRLDGTNLCVNVPNGNTALGTQVVLSPCSAGTPGPNETYAFGGGIISFGSLCLNVLGGTTQVGSRLGLWDGCGADPSNYNEVFTIMGPITALGQCVTMLGGSPFDGVPIGMFQCQNTPPPSQTWEYFF